MIHAAAPLVIIDSRRYRRFSFLGAQDAEAAARLDAASRPMRMREITARSFMLMTDARRGDASARMMMLAPTMPKRRFITPAD